MGIIVKRKKEVLCEREKRESLAFNILISTWKHSGFIGNCSVLSIYA